MNFASPAEEITHLKALLAETQAALAEAEEARRRLEGIVHEMRHEKFGAKSEKLSPDQYNLPLEDVELAQGVLGAAQEKAEALIKGQGKEKPRPRHRNRGQLPAHLPRVERIIEPESTLCPCGCGEMAKIGEDGRGGAYAEQFLQGFRGRFLQCDGYDGYDALTRVERPEGAWTLVHCWSHLRRRFVKLVRTTKSPVAEAALRHIAALYEIEAMVRGAPPEVRLAARQEYSAPIIGALKPWLEKQLSMASSGSRLATDIRYALGHWTGLTRFLEDGRLELDTNPVENAIRPVALTRKNALFAGHEVGAENWALLASLVATCKLNGVDPVAYLAATLRAILDGHPQSQIEDLMPWRCPSPSCRAA